jgi:undecaprenyl-diphosphatase
MPMISYFQAVILGGLQGVSELFPISSLGHSVILPSLLGWHINQSAPYFLTFLVATHFGTALVLFLFFRKDWVRIIQGVILSLKNREIQTADAKLGWLLIVGTIPAGILGILFQEKIQSFFAYPKATALFLMANGVLLLGAELLRRKRLLIRQSEKGSDERIARLTWPQTIGVGAAQAIALIPGFSRTGASLSGGLLVGLSHEDAARFAFLLATPIIFGASLVKLPELSTAGQSVILGQAIVGAMCAAFTAYFSVKFLTKYFETETLVPFALYCFLAGGISSIVLFFFR